MNWDDLRYVLAVGRNGTLAAAGRDLNVNPTTVGRRIIAIETDLQSRLFDRTGEGYAATPAGRLALAQAEEIENATLALSRQIAGSDQRVEGPVRLSGLDAAFDRFIIPRLPRLLERHPGLEVTFASNLDVVDLSRREADIALRGRAPSHPDAVGRKLGDVAMAVYAAREFTVGDAPPLVGLPGDLDGTGFSRRLAALFPAGRVAVRGNSEGHMHALVRAGAGIGLLDCFVGDLDPALERVLPDPVDKTETWAVTHVEMRRAPRVRAVMHFLSEIYTEDADLLAGRRPGLGSG